MTRKMLIPTGAALLTALGIAAGGVALADGRSAEEMKAFLDATPGAAEGLAAVEAQTGGTVVEAETEEDVPGLIEFEVAMADGSEQDLYWSLADGAVVTEADLLARFVRATPGAAEAIAAVEAETGGTVIEAEMDGEDAIEFEVALSDGGETEAVYTLADGAIAIDVEDDD